MGDDRPERFSMSLGARVAGILGAATSAGCVVGVVIAVFGHGWAAPGVWGWLIAAVTCLLGPYLLSISFAYVEITNEGITRRHRLGRCELRWSDVTEVRDCPRKKHMLISSPDDHIEIDEQYEHWDRLREAVLTRFGTGAASASVLVEVP